MIRLMLLAATTLLASARRAPDDPFAVRKGRGLTVDADSAVYCGQGVTYDQHGRGWPVHVWSNGRVRPAVAGGSDIPPTPAPPTPTPPAPAPGPTPQPDLDGLQRVIDDAKRNGETEATTAVLTALGFTKLDDATAWVQAKRDEETAQLTELEKRERQADEREKAAQARETEAARIALQARVTAALVTAGAPAEHVADLVDLVKVAADADDKTIAAAVDAKKTQFPALFAATPASPAPGGLPGGLPPKPTPPADPFEAGRQRAAAVIASRQGATRDDLIAEYQPKPSPLAANTA